MEGASSVHCSEREAKDNESHEHKLTIAFNTATWQPLYLLYTRVLVTKIAQLYRQAS